MIVGGSGTWLYLQVRAVESQLLIGEVKAAVEPLTKKLRTIDAASAIRQREPWLVEDLQALFADVPSLQTVVLHSPDSDIQLGVDNGRITSRVSSPLPADDLPPATNSPAAQRLHSESETHFAIGFDLTRAPVQRVRLDFNFDRETLLARVNEGADVVRRSIVGFSAVGAVGILLAIVITVVAMRVTRRMEVHFQEIYQRASLTEMAAALVHDLRNPLAALRANIKALLVAPDQTKEIVEELDRDVVALNDKLSAFLNLTRRHDDDLEPADICELVEDTARLAEPILSRHGLGIEMDIEPDLPAVTVRKASVRDALLNVLINAGQSGQTSGTIRFKAETCDDAIRFVIEDRGQGIPEQHLPRLFDAFYTTRENGTGLGLAIVQQVFDAHQGQVRIENRPQGGTRVVLTLPLHPKETPAWWNKQRKRFPA
jgi:signal transduction histidine kinase